MLPFSLILLQNAEWIRIKRTYGKKGKWEKIPFLRVLLISKVKTPYIIYAWKVFSLASEQHPYTLFSWGYPFCLFRVGWWGLPTHHQRSQTKKPTPLSPSPMWKKIKPQPPQVFLCIHSLSSSFHGFCFPLLPPRYSLSYQPENYSAVRPSPSHTHSLRKLRKRWNPAWKTFRVFFFSEKISPTLRL